MDEDHDPACRSERTILWDSKRSGDGARQHERDHDLGGALGFGSVMVEPNESVFHSAWESLAFALNMISIGRLRAYNADAYRHSVERVPDYLSKSYYERLFIGVTTLLVEGGVVSLAEVESLAGGSVPVAMPVAASAVALSSEFQEYERVQPTFAVGDTVRVIATSTDGHTRCPAYLRGALGTIERVYPLAHFPEIRAHTSLRCREHTYAVTFDARALWPHDRAPYIGHTVIVEVFESYLESGLGTSLEESGLGTNLEESGLGTNLEESGLGTSLEESRLGTNLEESPIRLAGRKGRSGGARSEAEMGPASNQESVSDE